METVGAAASHVAVAETADAGPVLTPSVAELATTVTATFDPPAGVTARVYDLPLPENAPFVPPVTVTSPAANPVTSSDQLNVAVSAVLELIFGGTPAMETVGAVASQSAVAETAAAGPVLPPPSVAASAATVTTTSTAPVGVTASVYEEPFTAANAPFAPPVTATSPVANPVTSSDQLNVTLSAAVESIFGGTPAMETAGAAVSQVAVAETADAGPVLTPSVAELATTVTVTLDPPAGVTARVYDLPLPANAPLVPPVTVTSPAANPVTSSDQLNVAVSAVLELIFGGTPAMETVGATASQVAVAETADAGPALRPSVTEFAATVTATLDPPAGVTTSVYDLPLPANAPFVPPVTVTSPAANPVTSSDQLNVAVSAVLELIFGGTPAMETVGATASQVAVAEAADAGPGLRPSVTESAATVTATLDPPAGVTARVYDLPLPANAPLVPPVTVTSPAANPVTSSDQLNVAVSAVLELIFGGTPAMETVGAVASQSAVAETAAAGPVLPPPSVAASAATVTTTSTAPVGVTASVYEEPFTAANAPFAPPVTATSPVANPVTSSDQLNVTLSAAVESIFGGTPAMETAGAAVSQVAVAETADAGPVLTPSVAELATTVTVTLDPPAGVTARVYDLPLPENAPLVPPVTVTSPVANPVTSSDQLNVAVSAVELIFGEMETVGATAVHRWPWPRPPTPGPR